MEFEKAEGTIAGGRKPKGFYWFWFLVGPASTQCFKWLYLYWGSHFYSLGFPPPTGVGSRMRERLSLARSKFLAVPAQCFPLLTVFAGAWPGNRMTGFVTGREKQFWIWREGSVSV